MMNNENAIRTLNFRGKARRLGKKSLYNVASKGKQNIIILGATMLLYLVFTIINTGFTSPFNVLTMVQSFAPFAIMGLGVTFVIATGGIDLSIGTVCIASAAIAGKLYMDGMPLALTIPVMIIIGTIFGLINGFLVAKLKLPAFIATLGTMMFSRGISALIVKIPNINFPTGSWFQMAFANMNDFAVGALWVIGLMLVSMFLMYKCKIGRYILAIGSNEEAARLSGIKTDKYKIIAYALAGLFAGIAAIFWAAANPTITSATGNGMELDAIAGVYIGGTSSTGGIASILGTVLGAMILVIIRQGLNFALVTFDVPINSTYVTYAITGIIVVVAVLMDVIKTKRATKAITESNVSKYNRNYSERMNAFQNEKDYILTDLGAIKKKGGNADELSKKLDNINAEISALRAEKQQHMPELRADDEAKRNEIKLEKEAVKAIKKTEKAERKKEAIK